MAQSIKTTPVEVIIGAPLAGLKKDLAAAEAQLRKFSRNATQVGAALTAVGGAGVAAFAAATRTFARAGDELDKMAARTGIGVAALSELAIAAELGGQDVQTFEKAIAQMQTVLRNAERGLSRANENLGALGLTFQDLENMRPEDQLQMIADRLAAIEDPTRRAGLAMQLLGGAGRQMLPLLMSMREGRETARQFGLTIDEDAARAAAKLTDQSTILGKTIRRLGFEVGYALAEPVGNFLENAARAVAVMIQWAKENHQFVRAAAMVAGTVAAIGAGLLGIGLAAKIAAIGVGLLGAAIGLLTSPITLIVAAIGAAVAGWLAFSKHGQGVVKDITLAMGDINDAIINGDLEGALELVLTDMEGLWFRHFDKVREAFTDFFDWVEDLWTGTGDWMLDIMGLTPDERRRIGQFRGQRDSAEDRRREERDREWKERRDRALRRWEDNRQSRIRRERRLFGHGDIPASDPDILPPETGQGGVFGTFNSRAVSSAFGKMDQKKEEKETADSAKKIDRTTQRILDAVQGGFAFA